MSLGQRGSRPSEIYAVPCTMIVSVSRSARLSLTVTVSESPASREIGWPDFENVRPD
jgi:hypothetical protein